MFEETYRKKKSAPGKLSWGTEKRIYIYKDTTCGIALTS